MPSPWTGRLSAKTSILPIVIVTILVKILTGFSRTVCVTLQADSKIFSYCGKIDIIKFAILTIVQFSGIQYIHNGVQPSSLSISRTFSSSQTTVPI